MRLRGRPATLVGIATLVIAAVAAPGHADWEQGVAAYRSKDYGTAAQEFEGVTKTNPDFAGAYYMLGLCQRAMRQLSPAVANLRKAVELDGDKPDYKIALGQALLDTNEYQQAYSLLKPLNISAIDGRLRSNYALLFASAATKTGRASEAIQVLSAQSTADAGNYRLFQALGVAQDAAGDDGKAFDAFKKAFSLDPKEEATGRSAVQSGILAARRSRSDAQKARYYREAGEIADRLVSTSPTFEHRLLAGETWLGAKNYDRALALFDQAKAQKPQNVLVHFYRAQCLTSLNRLDPAIDELQAALRIGPGEYRGKIYDQLGYALEKKGEYIDAKKAYNEAGNRSKAAEMDEKQAAKEQNLVAAREQDELRRTIAALELQIRELEEIGEVDDANELRKQLEELRRHLQ